MPERVIPPDSETINVPSRVWVYIPAFGIDLWQSTGRVCSVTVKGELMTFNDGALWSTRTHVNG
jgi:hypothetical protein